MVQDKEHNLIRYMSNDFIYSQHIYRQGYVQRELRRIYEVHNRKKLDQIPNIMDKYKGRYGDLMAAVYNKYRPKRKIVLKRLPIKENLRGQRCVRWEMESQMAPVIKETEHHARSIRGKVRMYEENDSVVLVMRLKQGYECSERMIKAVVCTCRLLVHRRFRQNPFNYETKFRVRRSSHRRTKRRRRTRRERKILCHKMMKDMANTIKRGETANITPPHHASTKLVVMETPVVDKAQNPSQCYFFSSLLLRFLSPGAKSSQGALPRMTGIFTEISVLSVLAKNATILRERDSAACTSTPKNIFTLFKKIISATNHSPSSKVNRGKAVAGKSAAVVVSGAKKTNPRKIAKRKKGASASETATLKKKLGREQLQTVRQNKKETSEAKVGVAATKPKKKTKKKKGSKAPSHAKKGLIIPVTTNPVMTSAAIANQYPTFESNPKVTSDAGARNPATVKKARKGSKASAC